VEGTLRGILASGEPAVGRRVLGRLPGHDEPRWRLASYFPVRDAAGATVAVAAVISDVTDQVALEQAVEQARDAGEREQAILEQVVAQVPVGIAVFWGPEHRYVVVNERGRAMIPARGELLGRTPGDVYPEAVELIEQTVTRAFREGAPVVQEELAVPYGGEGSFEGSRHYDVTFAPVRQGGDISGVVATYVEVTERVRERVTLQRELAEEHRLTSVLQRALLPAALPHVPGLALAARYEPARHAYDVGGDFYDVVAWDDDRWLLVLGDVSGKGPRAAAVSAVARSALRAALLYERTPVGLTRALDVVLRRELGGDGFVTLALAALGPAAADGGRTADVVLAGHPQPLLLHGGGARPVGAPGPALAVRPDPAWRVERVALGPGDLLLLYTDGLVEARRPRQVTPAQLAATAAATGAVEPAALVDALYEELVGGTSGGPDDVALLAARTGAGRAEVPAAADRDRPRAADVRLPSP
jgi:serine phosphatase RsbU (regulator of sigma subunit)